MPIIVLGIHFDEYLRWNNVFDEHIIDFTKKTEYVFEIDSIINNKYKILEKRLFIDKYGNAPITTPITWRVYDENNQQIDTGIITDFYQGPKIKFTDTLLRVKVFFSVDNNTHIKTILTQVAEFNKDNKIIDFDLGIKYNLLRLLLIIESILVMILIIKKYKRK